MHTYTHTHLLSLCCILLLILEGERVKQNNSCYIWLIADFFPMYANLSMVKYQKLPVNMDPVASKLIFLCLWWAVCQKRLLVLLLGASLLSLTNQGTLVSLILPDMTQEIDYLVVIKWVFFEEEVEVGACVPVFVCMHQTTYCQV